MIDERVLVPDILSWGWVELNLKQSCCGVLL